MSETRRLAAILAADVVGYSRLMGADEAGTARAVREHREAAGPIVRAFGGRLVKTMGDGVLLEFPSVVAAVECAIRMQQQMIERNAGVPESRRILYRVGVNLGDVLIEGEDILGDGVNIAARLEGTCEPGGVCISGSAYDHVRGRIEAEFADLGDQALKNIARPVRAYALGAADIAGAKVSAPSPRTRRFGLAPLAAAFAALLVVIAGGAWWFNRPVSVAAKAPAEAARLSLVVLPFANLSNDPNQDYFADGITENLTTDLSRIRGSFVIARNTAFTFKGKNIDAKQIGKELGVRYVLEGSVQRDRGQVRVNAQLIDAASGAHLWADRFEEEVADLFKLQDEVVARLANSLGHELVKAEAVKSVRSKNPDAIDLDMRGRALLLSEYRQGANREEIVHAAQALFERAIAIDADNPDALADAAFTYFLDYFNEWRSAATDYDAMVLGQVERAIALAPDNVWAYCVKSFYLNGSRRQNEGVRAIGEGLAINPNYPKLYHARGYAEVILGRYDQAKSDILQAMRLSPRDPDTNSWRTNLADAEIGLGHFDHAIDLLHQAIDAGYRSSLPYGELAAAYALAGKAGDASTALAEALRFSPKLTVRSVERTNPFPLLLEGLRKAGMPEQ
jgi:TolB-like protein/class 3 adenylate cyclase